LQIALSAHELVKAGEITPQLGIWLLMFAIRLELDLDKVLEMFNCQARVRSNPMLNELKAASDKLRELQQMLPPTNLQIAFAHLKLARIQHDRKQLSESDHHYKSAMEILFVNPKIPVENLIEVLDDYSMVKLGLNDAAEAIRISRMAMQERINCYGAETLPHAKGIEKLADIYCASGDHNTAVGGFKRALSVQDKPGATKEHELIHCLERLADCLVHQGDHAAAEQYFDRALQIAESSFGKNNETTRHIKKQLSNVCKTLGKMDKVQRYSSGSIDEMMMI
jgi:tetratricopeptide (TPR) repeat protein